MNRMLARTELGRPGRLTRITVLVAAAILLLAIILVSASQFRKAPASQAAVEAAIEDQYGLRVTFIAVTAGGGVLDFRFKIIDPEKADAYMHGPTEELPVLIVEKDGTRILPREHTHHVEYEFGRTYYTIYRNPRGIVKPGTKLTVEIGNQRLRNVVVQ